VKVSIIEANKSGAEHLSFNNQVLKNMLRDEDVYYLFSSTCHSSKLTALSGKDNVKLFKIPVYSILKRNFILKFCIELFSTFYALLFSKIKKADVVIFTSVFPPLLPVISVINRLLSLNVRIILHGELEGLLQVEKLSFSSYGFWVKVFYENGFYKNINSIVLSNGIYNRLLLIYPALKGHMSFINHPINMNNSSIKKEFLFATIGYATKKKHSVLFDKYVEQFRHKSEKLIHIGMADSDVIEAYSKHITFASPHGEALSEEQFSNYLSLIEYAVFAYGENMYNLAVSGAILDALGANCKVLTLKNKFALDLLEFGLSLKIVDLNEMFTTRYESSSHNKSLFDRYHELSDVFRDLN